VAPERKRSAGEYEQALRRQELAAGRALVQALPAEGSPGARELAAARRVLTQALFELRRLGRDLDREIEALRARQGPGGRAGSRAGGAPPRSGVPPKAARGDAPPRGAGGGTAARGAGPGELDRYEAVRNAVEEVAERWEGRREQLTAELERRQPGRDRRPGQSRHRPGGARGDTGVIGRSAATARPAPPRSRRSRRSPG
jgi:hypothetical protein